ncbi:DUF4192 domain-containing protein [Actinoplanes auranticolor]|uniref:DUF4192 family protein n=1 Tax=Actinoplanes auranticolor TaxID=47988 RepID=A0A919SN73_9ACTN|nr:DUF4192 domain-containing protein [Actinoplanes auranticolor]GIM75200.1 hypothetical protein Aau02nite_64720 [Actinoplanes auranticolor]
MKKQKVSSPAELISAVPFLIGFHPADSLVVVATQGALITFAVRIDLPEHNTPEEEARAAVLHLATIVLRQEAEAVTILGYGEERRVAPAVMRISDAFRKAGVAIVDELHVEDGRFRSYLCTDASCCPPEGQPCEPQDSVMAAEATFAGAVALPDREALEAQLTPVTGDDRDAMTAATARAVLRLAALAVERPSPPESVTPGGPQPDAPQPNIPEPDAPQPAGPRPDAPQPAGPRPDGPQPDAPELDAREPDSSQRVGQQQESRDDLTPNLRFHDGKPTTGPATASGWNRPGTVELRLGSVLWASLGLAMPLPDTPDTVAERPDLVADEDHFFAQVRRAGRFTVREAERCYSAGGRLSDDDVAWLGLLLLHVPVRDYAWTRTRTDDWELALWSDLVRRVEPRYRSAPAGLLAFVAWRKGLGPLASVAVQHALAYKDDYQLGVLVRAAMTTGLPPSVLDGWPAVEGLPPVADFAESEEPDDASSPAQSSPGATRSPLAEPQRDSRDLSRPSGDEVQPDAGKRREKLPVRVGPDRPGERPGKPERRVQKPRRAAHRRV